MRSGSSGAITRNSVRADTPTMTCVRSSKVVSTNTSVFAVLSEPGRCALEALGPQARGQQVDGQLDLWSDQGPVRDVADPDLPNVVMDDLFVNAVTPRCTTGNLNADELFALLAHDALVVTPTETVELVRDPRDNRPVEAALQLSRLTQS